MVSQLVGLCPCAVRRAAAFFVILCGGLLAPLHASPPLGEVQTIVFDDVVGPGNPDVTGLQVGPWLFASLQFHTVSQPDAGVLGLAHANDGTPYIASVGGRIDYPITLERIDGRPFALAGFDAAEGFVDDIAAQDQGFISALSIEIEAMLSSGVTVTLTFDLDAERDGLGGVDDFQSLSTIDEFRSVTSVTFTGLAGDRRDAGFALDNVVVGAVVPEPASATLLLAGAAVLSTMILVRRRNNSAGRRFGKPCRVCPSTATSAVEHR